MVVINIYMTTIFIVYLITTVNVFAQCIIGTKISKERYSDLLLRAEKYYPR